MVPKLTYYYMKILPLGQWKKERIKVIGDGKHLWQNGNRID